MSNQWKGVPWSSVTQEQKVKILMAWFKHAGEPGDSLYYAQQFGEESRAIYTLSKSAFNGSTSFENRCKVHMVYENYHIGWWALHPNDRVPFMNKTVKVTKTKVQTYVKNNPFGGPILNYLLSSR